MNFCVQILVDLISPKIIEKTGYRKAALCAFLTVMLGLTGFYWIPFVLPPYAGILLCMVCNAIGGGILEVIVSPMVEACPGENKEARMSFLHSFYCWGHMGVVLLSTLYFALAGIENWRFLPPLWALVPLELSCFLPESPFMPYTAMTKKQNCLKAFSAIKFSGCCFSSWCAPVPPSRQSASGPPSLLKKD